MARPSLQLAAGLLLLAGLLGLSTALIAEVREEVLQASEEAEGSPAREVADRGGLPVPEITLLDPTRAEVPDRERTREGMTTTGPATLHVDDGEGIQPAALTLDTDSRVVLGQGWEVDDERLTCTSPCQLDVDGVQLDVPADTELVPPRSTAQLGLPPAPEPGTEGTLPAGTSVELPPVRFPAGTRLDLQAGAQLQPPGTAEDWGPLLDDEPLQLPAGTVVVRSTASGADPDRLAEMLRRADLADPEVPDGLDAEQPTIRVTDTPEAIDKGQPFTVAGHVEDPEGRPLDDHPVTVYANATKQAPGLALHSEPARTDDEGRFTANVILPEEEPTRPYHILAQAHPRPMADPPLEAAWSDPVVPVRGEASLELDLPEAAGVGVPLGLRAHLLDAHDAPVPDQTIGFSLEGTDVHLAARTNAQGEAMAVVEEGLPYTGNYTVQAVFPGTDNVTGDEAQATIEVIDARIQAPATHEALRGASTEIQGRVVAEEGSPGRVRVTASYADDVTATTNSDREGRFTLELPVPADLEPGNHTVNLEAGAVDARHRLVLTVQAPLLLRTPDLGPQPVGANLLLPVDVVTDQATPVPGIPIEARVDGSRADRDTTDVDGRAHLGISLPSAGTHTVHLTADTPHRYTAQSQAITLRAAPLEVDADVGLVPGRPTDADLQLTVDDTPLAHAPIQFVGPGFVGQTTTDVQGQARLSLEAPATHPAGTVAANLSLPAHGITTDVPVRILEQPELFLEVTQPPREGQALRLTVTAQTDQVPAAGLPILARAQGAYDAQDQAVTDEQGQAHLTLPRPDDAEGPLQVDVLAEETQTTARAAESASVQATPAPTPWSWVLVGALTVGLAGAAALRHHRDPDTEPSLTVEPGPQLSLQIDGRSEVFGPVWHPDEPTALRLELTDADGGAIPNAEIQLEGPPGKRRLQLDEHGRARIEVPPHEAGTHTYRATFDGDDHGPAETVLELRIVDYREEIDRQYRRLHEAGVHLGLNPPDATPRELADALGPPADEMARLFERFDYAPHPVNREDYERFMQLLKEADPREPDA